MITGRFSFFFKEDAKWGEQEIIKFRWMLIVVVLLFIGYRYQAGMKAWAAMAFSIALIFVFYNLMLNIFIRKFKSSLWISYLSTTLDISILSFYIYYYANYYNNTAISTSATILLYPILIMFSVLRYNGRLVVYSTVLAIVAYNIVYTHVKPGLSDDMLNQVASMDWDGQVFRSAYLALMGYFMFSIPVMVNRLVSRQMDIVKERNDTETELALEKQKKKLAMSQLDRERTLNEKLNEQSCLIKEQKEKLEVANATKDRIFSIVGHDLRSPFSAQCSLTELLSVDYDKLSKEEVLEIVEAINKSAHQGIGLLSNLLDWATSQTGTENFIPEPVRIKRVVDETIALFYNNAKHKNIQISASLEDNLTICADTNMLETIIRNLLSNAIKFSHKGKDVEIKAVKSGSDILISVKDNGIGMSKEQIDNLFKVGKTSLSGTEGEPGTGLGLVLCKELTEKNNGSIDVQSELDKGSVIIIKLPVFSQTSMS